MTAESTPTLQAIILAGGLSSRMGQDKALIAVNGVPLLLRTCRVARQCTEQICVVTPWVERYQSLLAADGLSVQLIQEVRSTQETPPHGPLVGFLQGLAQTQTDWVLLLACDLPNLHTEVLQQWIAELPHVSKQVNVLLPQNPQGWWEPLCGLYRRSCQSSLEVFVQNGGRSFQRWLSSQSVQPLTLADPEMLLNCNTPEDLHLL